MADDETGKVAKGGELRRAKDERLDGVTIGRDELRSARISGAFQTKQGIASQETQFEQVISFKEACNQVQNGWRQIRHVLSPVHDAMRQYSASCKFQMIRS